MTACPTCSGTGTRLALRVRWPFARLPEDDVLYEADAPCDDCDGTGLARCPECGHQGECPEWCAVDPALGAEVA